MVFNPQNIIEKQGRLTIFGNICVVAHPSLNKSIIKEFWHNFTFKSSTLNISESEEFIFSIGNVKTISLDGCDYSINIEKDGVCVYAENEKNIMRGSSLSKFGLKILPWGQKNGLFCALDKCRMRL